MVKLLNSGSKDKRDGNYMNISIIKLLYEIIPHEVVEFVFNGVCTYRLR